MSPQEFSRRHEFCWISLERLLDGKDNAPPAMELPALYRQACQHLAIARERHYPPSLVDRLNRLVVEAHHRLYQAHRFQLSQFGSFLLRDFPALVRQYAGTFWLAALIFFLPLGGMIFAISEHPALIYSVSSAEQVRDFEHMYDPARRVIGFERDDATDFLMFGHYIRNNIGIGFRTFAGGIFFGIGSLAILLFNGVSIGAVAGHLTHIGYTETFYSFVIGHGAFELTAIVLSGMAGLMLGRGLIAPGRLSRGDALLAQARIAVKLVYGAFLFFFIAALLEAFWSSSTAIPSLVKFIVGGGLWLLVTLYFCLAGRRPRGTD